MTGKNVQWVKCYEALTHLYSGISLLASDISISSIEFASTHLFYDLKNDVMIWNRNWNSISHYSFSFAFQQMSWMIERKKWIAIKCAFRFLLLLLFHHQFLCCWVGNLYFVKLRMGKKNRSGVSYIFSWKRLVWLQCPCTAHWFSSTFFRCND